MAKKYIYWSESSTKKDAMKHKKAIKKLGCNVKIVKKAGDKDYRAFYMTKYKYEIRIEPKCEITVDNALGINDHSIRTKKQYEERLRQIIKGKYR